ncbi:MFS transporter [Nanoarchaeota archaeon]
MRPALKILLIASSLAMLAGGLFGPIYAVFVEQIGGDLLTAGGAYAAFSIAAGLLIFLISRWEDHVKHKEILVIIGYALGCIGFIGYLLVQEPWHLFIVQIIFGLGEAIGVPAFDGLYSKNLDHGKFVSEWGLWETMAYIIGGISALIGGYIANIYGFKSLFIIMLIISIIGLIASLSLLKMKNRTIDKINNKRKQKKRK